MKHSIIKSISSDLLNLAERLDSDQLNTDDMANAVRQVADQIAELKLEKGASPSEIMLSIDQIKNYSHSLHFFSKNLAGTRFESEFRTIAIQLTNTAPEFMEGIVKSIPGGKLLSCQLRKKSNSKS